MIPFTKIFLLLWSSTLLYASVITQAFEYPVDIVYLWVDGSDSEWQNIKDSWLVHEKKARLVASQRAIASDAAISARFADNEELRYSLRAIWKYAHFVNHIYIVTMNQKPQWLIPHPMITVVDHKEIFKNIQNLPTFNSHAIESNLHRIPNLCEHYIYFNDDVFLGDYVSPSDFFTRDGMVKVLFEPSLSPSGPPLEHETAYRRAWRNTNALLDAHYTPERRYRLKHAPFALRKSYVEQFDREFPHVFASNSSHKFRSDLDFNVTNGLLQYYWLYHGKMVSGELDNIMVTLRTDQFFERTQRELEKIQKVRPHTYCLEDNMEQNSSMTKELMHQFLEQYYPVPAPWEG